MKEHAKSRTMSVVFIWLLQLTAASCLAQHPVQSFYNRELINDIKILEQVKGAIEINRIEVIPADGPAIPYLELINGDIKSFSGKVGVSIPLPELPSWWQFAHWWEVEVEAVWTPTRAVANFILECFDENGAPIARVPLIERPAPCILGFPIPDIPDVTNNMTPQRYHFPLVAVPKAKTSDPSRKAVCANLTFWFTDWHGTVRIKSLKIRPFQFTAELKEQWRVEGPYTFGGLPWFEPTYLSSYTSVSGAASKGGKIVGYRSYSSPSSAIMGTDEGVIHDTLRDTGHKLLAAAGMHSMRYHGLWEDLEPARRCYLFDRIEALIEELAYYGAEIGVMTVHGMPVWAYSRTIEDVPDELAARMTTWNIIFPPDDWNDYEEFVRRLVSRFKGRIIRWEVWNEPNSHVWGVRDPRKSYQQFLMRFYTEAKKIDPDCIVQCGRVGWWIHDMLRDGMGEYMDEIALHPYPGAAQGGAEEVIRQFREVQLSLMAAGLHIPIEVTEWGLGASYPWTGPGAQNDEKAKAQRVEEILNAMKEVTRAVYWYTPIQANRQYGLLQYESDRYRPVDSYWAFGRVTGELSADGGPVKAHVIGPDMSVAQGQVARITLVAENTSNQKQNIKFWPVGFIDSIGIKSLEQIRQYDWTGTLGPGQRHEVTIEVQPQETAYGRYPVGLVIMNELSNCLALTDIWIESVAALSTVTASSCNAGSVEAINDLLTPVWSGDEDVPALVWMPEGNERSEWVQMDFGSLKRVSEVEIFWFADPVPHYPLRGRQSRYADIPASPLTENQRMDAHGMELINPAQDIAIRIEGYGNFATPQKWVLLYRDTQGNWKPVENVSGYGAEPNLFNRVRFKEVYTEALRIEIGLKPGKGGGVHEWRVR